MRKNIKKKIKYLLSKVKRFFEMENCKNPYVEYVKNYFVEDIRIGTEPLRLEWDRSKPEFKELLKSLKTSFKRFLSLS